MVWDSTRERMLLFGGYRNEEYLDDTWAYDTKTSDWVQLQTTGNPPARSQHGMVYDPDRDEILLFGGRGTRTQPLHDTWSLDLDTLQWNMLPPPSGAPHPRARDHVQMARDPLSGITVIRGHSLGEELPDETWHFDTEARTWTWVETKGQPQGASHGLLCAVEAAGGLMFLGGDSDPQTWLYEPRTTTWTQLEPGAHPITPNRALVRQWYMHALRLAWVCLRARETKNNFFSFRDWAIQKNVHLRCQKSVLCVKSKQ